MFVILGDQPASYSHDDDHRTNLPALLMSLQMLMRNFGANFTAPECCAGMREAGRRERRAAPPCLVTNEGARAAP